MGVWSSIHHPVPGFAVSVHCITIFLARLVLLTIMVLYLRKKGRQMVRANARRTGRPARIKESVMNVLAVWVPVRLMCPGLILRLGHWSSEVAKVVFPESLDVFSKADKSKGFWLAYGWAEVFVLLSILWTLWHTGIWVFGTSYYNKARRIVGELLGTVTPEPVHSNGIWSFLRGLFGSARNEVEEEEYEPPVTRARGRGRRPVTTPRRPLSRTRTNRNGGSTTSTSSSDLELVQ